MSYSLSKRKRAWLGAALAGAMLVAPMASGLQPAQAQELTSEFSNEVMPWLNETLTPQQRTELLLAHMTEDEKIHMLHGASSLIGTRTINKDHPKSIGYIPAIERLRIPALVMTDGPAGLRNFEKATVLPAPIVQAASFDTDVAHAAGQLIAQDSKDRGQDLLFGPGFNIGRNPQAGRTFEYFGEDPYLSGVMASANVQGLQGEGIMANLKHFVANNQETNRTLNSSNIDERTLHEIYEKPFFIAVEGSDPASVMCAYNQVNNKPACGNPETLMRDLRGHMNFQGFVVTDYPAAHAPTDIKNGLNVELPGADHTKPGKIRDAIAKGEMSWDDVDARLRETFVQMFRFGLFDHEWDWTHHDRVRVLKEIPADRGHQVALDTALAGSVLLKNENGALPINAEDGRVSKVLVIGTSAKKAMLGGGSSAGMPIKQDSALEEIQKRYGRTKVVWKSEWDPMGIWIEARSADRVIVFADQISTELIDRPNLDLLPHMTNAINIAARHNDHVTVVTQAGGPILMPWLDNVEAVLNVWYPGQAGGEATAKLLFGEVNPSGRLPQTFPAANGQFPAHEARQFPGASAGFQSNYDEGVFVGYRWYSTYGERPLFPFGYGLSYTSFEYSNFRLVNNTINAGESFQVAVDVTNTGSVAGKTVPQVYVTKPVPDVPMPAIELAAFQKIDLQPGETRTVTMTVDPLQLAYWDTKGTDTDTDDGWNTTVGEYRVHVGDNVDDIKFSLPLYVQ